MAETRAQREARYARDREKREGLISSIGLTVPVAGQAAPAPVPRPGSGGGSGSGNYSSELNNIAAADGISLDLSAGRTTGSPDDPPAWDGSANVPVSQLYNRFYVLSDAELRRFQQAAVTAGIVKPENMRFGAYDDETFRLWNSAVNQSAGFLAGGKKVDPFTALEQIAALTPPDAGKEPPVPPSAVISHPDSIKAGLKEAAVKVLGGTAGLDDKRLDQLVAEFQKAQQRAQLAAGQAQREGGTSVAAPEFAAFAEEQVREVDPLKADSRKVVEKFDVIAKMFRGESV